MFELIVLGSGSRGNCSLVRFDRFAVLIDAGFSARQIGERLRSVDQDPADIDGILLTHEHSDHVAGLRVFTRRFPTSVLANEATLAAADGRLGPRVQARSFATGEPFEFGPFAVETFAIPHDAAEPVGFVLEAGGRRLGYATDLGHVTAEIAGRLEDCDALVFEANHDREMLRDGPYPMSTKQRVASELGHLSNCRAAAELPRFLTGRTKSLILAHLSETNNDPGLACATVSSSLKSVGLGALDIRAAPQRTPLAPVRL